VIYNYVQLCFSLHINIQINRYVFLEIYISTPLPEEAGEEEPDDDDGEAGPGRRDQESK